MKNTRTKSFTTQFPYLKFSLGLTVRKLLKNRRLKIHAIQVNIIKTGGVFDDPDSKKTFYTWQKRALELYISLFDIATRSGVIAKPFTKFCSVFYISWIEKSEELVFLSEFCVDVKESLYYT